MNDSRLSRRSAQYGLNLETLAVPGVAEHAGGARSANRGARVIFSTTAEDMRQ